MKNLIFKKFFSDTTEFFVFATLTLSIIVWTIQAVNYLDFVTEDGHGLEIYFKYTILNLPKIISRIMPLIFFITLYHNLNKFEDNNELKIFWINGIDKKIFINKVMIFSLIFFLIQFILNIFIVPNSQIKARTYIQKSNIDFFPSLINEKKFIDTVDKLTIYIDKKKNENTYDNIFLKDIEANGKIRIIYAKAGNLNNTENNRSLTLYDGKIVDIKKGNITSFNFSSTVFDLSKYITKSIIDFKIQEQKTLFLIECNINYHYLKKEEYFNVNRCNDSSKRMTQEELFKRIFKPLYYLSFALCACFLLLFSKESNNFKFFRLLIFIFGILLIFFSEISSSFSSSSDLQFLISIFLPILIYLILLSILYQQLRSPKI